MVDEVAPYEMSFGYGPYVYENNLTAIASFQRRGKSEFIVKII